MIWGSEEFIKLTQAIPDEYIRPVDSKSNLQKISECDMLMMQPLLDLGLWVRASEKEIREWIINETSTR